MQKLGFGGKPWVLFNPWAKSRYKIKKNQSALERKKKFPCLVAQEAWKVNSARAGTYRNQDTLSVCGFPPVLFKGHGGSHYICEEWRGGRVSLNIKELGIQSEKKNS